MPVHTTFVSEIHGAASIFQKEFLHGCRGENLMLGIIGGTSLLFSTLPDLKKEEVATPFGSADSLCGDIVMLMRHQHGRPLHRINYRVSLAAMAIAGVDRFVAFGSSGSLKKEIAPGTILIPTDYISMTDIPSIHDHKIEYVRPELSRALAEKLSSAIPGARPGAFMSRRGGRGSRRSPRWRPLRRSPMWWG